MHRVLWLLGISVLALLAAGFIVLASAGGGNGMRLYGDANHFLVRQAFWLAVSLPCLWAASRFDYHKWREMPWLTVLMYHAVFALLVGVLFCPETKGSRRWIGYGMFRVQPSELAKLAVVVATAVYLDRKGWMLGKFWKGAVRAAFVVAVPVGLAVLEPDFGAAAVLGLAGAALFLLSGMRVMHFAMFAVIGVMAVGTLVAFNPNRMNRIHSWVRSSFQAAQDKSLVAASEKRAEESVAALRKSPAYARPDVAAVAAEARAALALARSVSDYKKGRALEENVQNVLKEVAVRIGAEPPAFTGLRKSIAEQLRSRDKRKAAAHQLEMALVAIHDGGVAGRGFNNSRQKQQYLPEAHTDFIFAIGAEEFGLAFSLGLLGLFVAFFWCGIYISLHAPDRLGRLIAFGMSFLVFFQALFNIGVVTGCLPTKGIALPFISYGGTNLLTAMIAVGFLFNVGRQIGLQTSRVKSRISPVFSTQGV